MNQLRLQEVQKPRQPPRLLHPGKPPPSNNWKNTARNLPCLGSHEESWRRAAPARLGSVRARRIHASRVPHSYSVDKIRSPIHAGGVKKGFIRRLIGRLAALVCASMLTGCANPLFYQPDRTEYQTPAAKKLAFEPVTFASEDGTKLSGWFVPAVGPAKGTVLHCHGNAQNMTAHFSYVDWLPHHGYNVFVFDYRGYGESAGTPEREGVFQDTLAALNYLRTRTDINTNKLLIFGQSLGGANAIAALAADGGAGVRAITIDSSFYSYRMITRDKIKMIPVLSLLRWPLSYLVVSNGHSPGDAIGKLPSGIPLLIIHGKADRVIPWQHGQKLFDAAHDPKYLMLIEDADHTQALFNGTACRAYLIDFFDHAVGAYKTK